MKVIDLFQVNIFMPVRKLFPCFVVWQSQLFCKRRPFRIFGQFRGFSKKPMAKNWGFCMEKEREKKTWMAKAVKSCHQLTWAQKSVTKKRVNFLFQNLWIWIIKLHQLGTTQHGFFRNLSKSVFLPLSKSYIWAEVSLKLIA